MHKSKPRWHYNALLLNYLVEDLLDDLQVGVTRAPVRHREPDSLLTSPRRAAHVHLARVVDPVGQRLLLRLLLREQNNVEGHNVVTLLPVQ